jgi:hypothetical protein
MAEDETVTRTLQIEMEADKLREAKYNLEGLIGLATQIPILKPYVKTFNKAISTVQNRLREIGADEPDLDKYLSTE